MNSCGIRVNRRRAQCGSFTMTTRARDRGCIVRQFVECTNLLDRFEYSDRERIGDRSQCAQARTFNIGRTGGGEMKEQTDPAKRTPAELCQYILDHMDGIKIRAQVRGKWNSVALTEVTGREALEWALELVKKRIEEQKR